VGNCNYKKVCDSLQPLKSKLIVLNITDGTQSTGWGVGSLLNVEFENRKIPYTGASAKMYQLDESKKTIKQHLVSCSVSTPKYVNIPDIITEKDVALIEKLNKLHFPVLIKPDQSGSSFGLFDKSVCYSVQDILDQVNQIIVEFGPCFIEEFIIGREYTVFCFSTEDDDVQVLMPLERKFNSELKEDQKFLTYDNKWKFYDQKWWYAPVEEKQLHDKLVEFSRNVYIDAKLNGYSRFDIRQSGSKFYVLDVNLNCSLNLEPDSALQLIFKYSNCTTANILQKFFLYALKRNKTN